MHCPPGERRKETINRTLPGSDEEQQQPDPCQSQRNDHVWKRENKPRTEVDTGFGAVETTSV